MKRTKRRVNTGLKNRASLFLRMLYRECKKSPDFGLKPLCAEVGIAHSAARAVKELGIIKEAGGIGNKKYYWACGMPDDLLDVKLTQWLHEYNQSISDKLKEKQKEADKVVISEEVDYKEVGEQLATNSIFSIEESASEMVKQQVITNENFIKLLAILQDQQKKIDYLYSQFK